MNKIFKNILSYIWPIKLEVAYSQRLGRLEITLENGRTVLNGVRANYSYGMLQKVFELVFSETQLSTRKFQQILILGFGGGSVVKVLRDKYGYRGRITGVELDDEVIRLSEKYFAKYYKDVDLIKANAFDYIKKVDKLYDLIIVDLFNDNLPEKESYTLQFVKALKNHLASRGLVYHNLMLDNPDMKSAHATYKEVFSSVRVLHPLAINQVIYTTNDAT